jgi:hypothetical protein
MSRRARIGFLIVFAAGCGSSTVLPDGGAGGVSGAGRGGTTGGGGASAAGTTGAAGLTGGAGTTGVAGAGVAGTTGVAGRGGTTGIAGSAAAGTFGTAGVTGAGGTPMAGVNLRVFSGTALLLDQGPSCTQEESATVDRWCAFLSLSPTQTVRLSVLNVSQAIRGAIINCTTGTDPNCLILTSAWAQSDDGLHPTLFQGDTLTYFDSSATPYVWRPGMPSARRLVIVNTATTGDVLGCQGSSKGTAVVCLRDLPPAMQPSTTTIVSEVLGGRADSTANPLLARFDQVIAVNSADTDYARFSYGFPAPGSGHIAWTSRATATGPEILKVAQVDNAATPTTVASDVHDWDTSPDGSRWYWVSGLTGSPLAGTLQTAPFPAGAGPATVLAGTVQFAFPTTAQSLVTLNNTGALSSIADPVAAPMTQVAIDTGVGGFVRLSRQGHVAYLKMYDAANDLTDLLIRKWDASNAACTSSATPNVFYPAIAFTSDSAAGIFPQFVTNMFQGQYTRLSDCNTTIVAANIVAMGSIGDRAVLFEDTFNSTTGNGTIRFRTITAGALAAGTATVVSADVGSFDTSGPAPGVLIYTVNAGAMSPNDGVFVRYFGN